MRVLLLAALLALGCATPDLDGVVDCGAQYVDPAYTLPGDAASCWVLVPEASRALTLNEEVCPGSFGEVRYARGGDVVHMWAPVWEADHSKYQVRQVNCLPGPAPEPAPQE